MRERDIRLFITANSVVGLGFGVVLLAAPGPLAALLGLHLQGTAALMARLYGAELCGFGVATWLAREVRPLSAGLVVGHVSNETLTAAVLFAAALSGLGNVLLPVLALAPTVFALGYLALTVRLRQVTASGSLAG